LVDLFGAAPVFGRGELGVGALDVKLARAEEAVYVFEVATLTKEKTDPYSKDSSRLEPRIVALYEVGYSCRAISNSGSENES
jgi:hypothetical protein